MAGERYGRSISRRDGRCFQCNHQMLIDTVIFYDNVIKKYICRMCFQQATGQQAGTPAVTPAPDQQLRRTELEALKARVASLESQVARLLEIERKSIINDKLEAKPKDIFDGYV